MKKIIMLLGYVFLAVIVLAIAGAASVAIMGKRLDKESKGYVDAALPAIITEWDISELQKRASPEFDASVDYDDLEDYFESLRELGKLEEYQGSTGDSNITISPGGYEITADYTATADFEKGSVELQVSLIKHNGSWQILDFRVNPEESTERKDVI
ncbi:MAG: hypothetical protein M0Z89_08435 [Nitrospiraceae bacterium]|nr:hypothetical protein [Nitrospiraceae bacterium]